MKTKIHTLLTLFVRFFAIALFVVGGGYSILLVADELFSKKLKWTKEGEIIEHLPLFQMIPGIIATHTATYVGMKVAGRIGSIVGVIAVTLPSVIIFLIVSTIFTSIPLDNKYLNWAFLGLRSSLTGIILATIIKGWKKGVNGIYGYICVILSTILLQRKMPVLFVLIISIIAGIILYRFSKQEQSLDISGCKVSPLKKFHIYALSLGFLILLTTLYYLYPVIFTQFFKFGCICFGGGFVLVPAYLQEFVGETAPYLNLPREEFGNIVALTQITPGPVSINSATFFGYRLNGIGGALVASFALLLPGTFLISIALSGLEKWKNSYIVRGISYGVRPATIGLMLSAVISFSSISVWSPTTGLNPQALLIMLLSLFAILSHKLSVITIIFLSLILGILLGL